MIRVILDTNIIVSALLNPQGAPAQVLLFVLLEPEAQLCLTGAIYAEYEEVLRRPKLQRSDRERDTALRAIRERAVWVKAGARVHACSDPDDDIFLECAQEADASYLVTGNTGDFPTKWGETQIVTPRRFLDAMS